MFGAAVKMVTENLPRAVQINAFFGVDGLESLDGRFRGRVTRCSGILYGGTPYQCGNAVEFFRSYDDGLYYVLVDTGGGAWPLVRLLSFSPQDRAYFHSQLGFCRNYTASFIHLG